MDFMKAGASAGGHPSSVDPAVAKDVARMPTNCVQEDLVMPITPGQAEGDDAVDEDLLKKIRDATDTDEHYKALRTAQEADSPQELELLNECVVIWIVLL